MSGSTIPDTAVRLARLFEAELDAVVEKLVSLPDTEQKQDLIHVRRSGRTAVDNVVLWQSVQYQLARLKREATQNCHAAIFSTVLGSWEDRPG